MYRIDNATSVSPQPAIPAVGPNPDSFFSGGDPTTGALATIVDANWLNSMQEELCGVVVGAGLALDKTDQGQLLDAINALKGRFAGSVSGVVTVQPQAAAGTFNFNLPTSAGASGAPLLSGGGGASAMTWGTVTGSGNFVKSASPTLTGTVVAEKINSAALNSGSGITAPAATGVWTNLFTPSAPGGELIGLFLVSAKYGNEHGATALVQWSEITATVLDQWKDNAFGIVFRMSGGILQAQQEGAGSNPIGYVWQRIM